MSLITTFRYWCIRKLLTNSETDNLLHAINGYIDALERRAVTEKFPAYDDCKQEIADISVMAHNIFLR